MSDLKLDVGQAVELKEAFRREGYTNAEIKMLCERKGFLRQALEALYQDSCAKLSWNKVTIDRSTPFDNNFLGDDWKDRIDEKCSLSLTEIDFGKLEIRSMFKRGEKFLTFRENRRRLQEAGYISLDARVFQMFWENKSRIPKSWKKIKNGRIPNIIFDGTVVRGSVTIIWFQNGEWCTDTPFGIDDPMHRDDCFSAVIAP